MKWHICPNCEKTLATRQSLWRHKKKCIIVEDPIPTENNEQSEDQTSDFIEKELFNQLRSPVKWNELEDSIYKLGKVYNVDCQSVADLTDGNGTLTTVILPVSVLQKLSLCEMNIIYLKPLEGEDVEIVGHQ